MPRIKREKGKGKKEEKKDEKAAKPMAKTDKPAAKKEGTSSSAPEAAIPVDVASIASTTDAPAKTAKPVARIEIGRAHV